MERKIFKRVFLQILVIIACLLGSSLIVYFILSEINYISSFIISFSVIYYAVVSLLCLIPILAFKKKMGNQDAITIPISYTISLIIVFIFGCLIYFEGYIARRIGFELFLPQAVICCIASWIFYAVTILKKKKEI